ncbi:unnamed protein product [Camellia sinensis]
MDSNIGKNIDRISNLPDALLCHILSFLPTKYAVGTSTLSTRWQYLWTSVPNLDFDDSKCFQEYARLSEDKRKEVDLSFQYFVNRVLLLSDAPCFQKFHLQIGGSLELLDLVDTWISAAVKRNVEDLNLINGFEINVRLPVRLFTSKTLVILSLSGVLLDIPCSVWLPSLKSLRLDYVEYGDEDSLQQFLIGCPILEEMYIHRWTVDSQMVLNVSVPTLKRLTVFCYRDDFIDQLDDSDEPDDQGCKLVVDAPQLEYLYLADCVDILLRNLPSLSKASFFVRHVCLRRGSFIDGLRMYKLLSGITNVKVLEAHLAFQTDVNDYMLPTFHNLTQLNFGADFDTSWNLKLLADLLRCSPNLEVLILTGSIFSTSAACWNPPQEVPSCLLLHLKKINVKAFRGKDYELDVIEYLLRNAKVLRKMTIDCQYSDDCCCGELAAFPRGSKTCQLNLLLTERVIYKIRELSARYFRKIGSFEDEKQFVVFFDFREDVKHLVEIVNLAEYSRWRLP